MLLVLGSNPHNVGSYLVEGAVREGSGTVLDVDALRQQAAVSCDRAGRGGPGWASCPGRSTVAIPV